MFNQELWGQKALMVNTTATLPTALASPSLPLLSAGLSSPARSSDKRGRRRASWQIAVVDGCHYGRVGLVTALGGVQWNGLKLRVVGMKDFGALSMLQPPPDVEDGTLRFDCLVVRLPSDPRAALCTLLQLGVTSLSLPLTAHLVVLSALTPEVVLRVLSRIGVKLRVRVLDDRLPLAMLCQAVCPQDEWHDRETMAWSRQLLANTGTPQLSVKERGVLWQCLQMVSVHTLARRLKMSSKTLYTQRQGAIHKLGAAHLNALLRQFRVLPDNR